MKEGIHPKYNVITVVCACGESFQTRSTRQEMRLEICSKCHPFFTGKQKLIDSAGRVERFQRRYKNAPAPGGKKAKAGKDAGAKVIAADDKAAPAGEGAGA